MNALESLKIIADYDKAQNGYGLGSVFGTSKTLGIRKNKQGEDVIEVQAPSSFLGHALSWIKGISQDEQKQQMVLHAKISQALLQTGIGYVHVDRIIREVMSRKWSSVLTKRDLRQMIAKAEEIAPRKKIDVLKQDKLKQTSSASSLLTKTNSTLSEGGSISGEENFRDVDSQAEKKAEELIQGAQQLLKEVTFDPKEIFQLRERVERQRAKVESHFVNCSSNGKEATFDQLEEELGIREEKEKPVLPLEMLMQLRELGDHLIVKEKMLSQYLQRDPFSNKNVLYPRKVYAKAAELVFQEKLAKVDESQRKGLERNFQQWYEKEVDSYEQADSMKRSQELDFYLDKTNPENPLVKYSASRAAQKLSELLSASISKQEIEQAASKAMNEHLAWEKVESDIIFSFGGKTQAYRQVSTPLSEGETAMGADLRNDKIRGMIPSARDDGRVPINARMTQLFKIEKGEKILLHERQQHGINDHFAIQDPEKRRTANLNSMKQLIQSGAEADPAFIQDAIGNPAVEHQLFYINTNLTTPTWTPRGNKNDEYTYSRHQGAAMGASEGPQTFSVLNPENSEERADINLNVTCIDFRFPVNYAISSFSEDKRSIDPGMIFAWPALKEHNEGEFKKLFGRLDSRAPIEGIMKSTYKKLEEKVAAGDQGAIELKAEIDEQVDYVRHIFRTDAYKSAGDDRFKMPRHIDLLVNAFRQASELVDDHSVRVVNAGGCMSGKDREGVANAENEAAIIIQDLGGNIEPGRGGRYNEETQAIYDHCMTGVVHNTHQVTGIGGSKNAEEIKKQMRDPYAIAYAKGASSFVSA